MAEIKLTLPDDALAEVVTALCENHGYGRREDGESAPTETRPKFARRMIVEFLKRQVREYRRTQAHKAAEATLPNTDPDIT